LATNFSFGKGYVCYIGDFECMSANEWSSQIRLAENKPLPIKVPIVFIRLLAIVGDLFAKCGIKFPMTSFRLNNMMTNNVIKDQLLCPINKFPIVDMKTGVKSTIDWLNSHE